MDAALEFVLLDVLLEVKEAGEVVYNLLTDSGKVEQGGVCAAGIALPCAKQVYARDCYVGRRVRTSILTTRGAWEFPHLREARSKL